MTTATDMRQELCEFAEQRGWQRHQRDRIDFYVRGSGRVHVLWQGTSAISGAAHYDDHVLYSYTRDLAKIQSWLTR